MNSAGPMVRPNRSGWDFEPHWSQRLKSYRENADGPKSLPNRQGLPGMPPPRTLQQLAMTRRTLSHPPLTPVWLFATLAVMATGCSSLDLPAHPFSKRGSDKYLGVDGSVPGNLTEQAYHSVRKARSENAIVLEIASDSTPIRVLPLPPGQESVYVSNLLKETGISQKLGSIEATLFRHSTDAIGGIPMEVKMSPDGRHVQPESDYALQAGDRLAVREATSPAVKGMLSAVLGL